MELVVVGLPGSGKTAVGRRVAARHGATFVDLDEEIERAAGRRVPEIFEAEGEAGFRRRERAAIEALGAAGRGPRLTRVIAPGGGAIVDPRNRWRLFRGRRVVWLDVRHEVLAQRLRRSPNVRPLDGRARPDRGAPRPRPRRAAAFYAAARAGRRRRRRWSRVGRRAVEEVAGRAAGAPAGRCCCAPRRGSGRLVIGEGILAGRSAAALARPRRRARDPGFRAGGVGGRRRGARGGACGRRASGRATSCSRRARRRSACP